MPWGVAAAAVVGAVASNVAGNKASAATDRASSTASAETRRSTAAARNDLLELFPSAQAAGQQGFQGALDVFSQSVPAQQQAFQGGNVAAQNQILSGLPQIQNALFGNQVDLGQLQAFSSPQQDLSFLNQQLPFTQQQNANAQLNGGLGGFTQGDPNFNGVMGPFQPAQQSVFDRLGQSNQGSGFNIGTGAGGTPTFSDIVGSFGRN